MKNNKKKRKTMMADFLKNVKLSRRDFVKASVATGAAVAFSNGLKPEMKALAAATAPSTEGMGKWMPATCQGWVSGCRQPARDVHLGVRYRCI